MFCLAVFSSADPPVSPVSPIVHPLAHHSFYARMSGVLDYQISNYWTFAVFQIIKLFVIDDQNEMWLKITNHVQE